MAEPEDAIFDESREVEFEGGAGRSVGDASRRATGKMSQRQQQPAQAGG
jgi:hypothetical protein